VEPPAALSLAQRILSVELPGWRVRLDNARTRLGSCSYDSHTITLSRHHVELNNEATVTDTILHEVAHALAGRDIGHGPAWKEVARRLGATPKRCAGPEVKMPDRRFIGKCPACDKQVQRHTRRNIACRDCCALYNRGRYSPVYRIIWTGAEEETLKHKDM
jgi:predicted SprT family Zn-dependent metalloprotease